MFEIKEKVKCVCIGFGNIEGKENLGELPRYYRRLNLAFVAACLICILLSSIMTNRTARVSAVTASGVGVYWDSNLSNSVSSINWETLTPGSTKSKVVYVRNEAEEPAYLRLATANWDPSETSGYLNLGWDYSGQQMSPDENLKISLTLSLSRNIKGVSSFSFDIIIKATDNFPADINDDGVIDIRDFVLLAEAFGSQFGDPEWNQNADISPPYGIIDICDLVALALNFTETRP